MKKLFFTLFFITIASVSYSDTYVCIDKETGKCLGTVNVNPEYISEWNNKYTMKLVDESFNGKQGYEIKIENGKARIATDKEVQDYNKDREFYTKDIQRQKILTELGITQEQLNKLKAE
jgi:hypothetical protein